MEKEGKTIWWYFHTFRRLAEEGKVRPLSCPDCDANLITRLNKENEDLPDLWCSICDTKFSPGLDLFAQIQAVVGEWEL